MKRQDWVWGYLLIAPLVLGLTYFYIIPFFQNIFYSFTSLDFGKWEWIGLDNYRRLLTDKSVRLSFRNTAGYAFIGVPVGVTCSLYLAILLNTKVKFLGLYRTLLFLPAITMPSAIGMIWRWLMNRDFGLLNQLLAKAGVEPISWLGNPKYVFWSLLIVIIWGGVAYSMIILLAGLQSIPAMYYEAAEIDGAGPFLKFIYVTVPMLTPTLFFVIVTSLIGSFQVYDVVLIMLGKGSLVLEDGSSVVYWFYRQAFEVHDMGYAAAIGCALFVVILTLTLIQFKLQKRWVHY